MSHRCVGLGKFDKKSESKMFNSLLLTCFIINMSIQWSVYVISVFIRSERFFDFTGAFTFILLANLSYEWSGLWSIRQTIQTGMVCTWGVRLGLYLFFRILKEGHDRRFDRIRVNPVRFFTTWTLQGVWVFVTVLPTLMVNLDDRVIPLTTRDYCGWALWVIGFTVEVIADYQKAVFRNNPKNKGQFISTGLWRWSRHPNYCGEIMLWIGLYVSASSVLRGAEFLAVFCPLFDYVLITKVSGIPYLEKHGLKRWGTNASYQQYLRTTPLLFPFPW